MSRSLREQIRSAARPTLFLLAFALTLRLLFPFYSAFLTVWAVDALGKRLAPHTTLSQKALRLFLLSFLLLLICLLSSFLITSIKKESIGFLTQLYETLTLLIKSGYHLFVRIKERFAIGELFSEEGLSSLFQTLFTNAAEALTSRLTAFATAAFKALPNVLLATVIYLLAAASIACDFEGVTATVASLVPERLRPVLKKAKRALFSLCRHTLRAYGILFLITFGILTVAFFLFRIDYPVWWALLTASLDALPAIGIGIVLVPRAIAFFFAGKTGAGVAMLLFYLALTLFRQAIEPRILGKELGAKPIVSLAALYLGFRLFGVFGIVASPLLAVLITRMTDRLLIKTSTQGDPSP